MTRRTSVWAASAARNAASMVRRAATARSAAGSAVSTPRRVERAAASAIEDITEAEGKLILKQAQETVDWVKAKGFKYGMNSKATDDPETWTEIDCTRFAWKALGTFGGPRFSSVTLDGNCNLRRVDPKEARAGDVLGQPRPKDDPGSQHVGIAQGVAGPKGGQLGIAMGNSGAAAGSVWGLDKERRAGRSTVATSSTSTDRRNASRTAATMIANQVDIGADSSAPPGA